MYWLIQLTMATFAVLLSWCHIFNTASPAAETPGLFISPSQAHLKEDTNQFIIRQRMVIVDKDAFRHAHSASSLVLNLFEDTNNHVIVHHSVTNHRGTILLTGTVPGVESGKAILILQGDALSGTVFLQNHTYQIRPAGNRLHVVREIRKYIGADPTGLHHPLPFFEQKIIELVNNERLVEGLSPLRYNSSLGIAARNYAEDMAANKHFGHTRRDGRKFFQTIFESGYPLAVCGENLAVGFSTPEEVFEGWISSLGHRQNILHAKFTEIGVGHATGLGAGNNRLHYWAQNFGGANVSRHASSMRTRPFPDHLSLTRLFSRDYLR